MANIHREYFNPEKKKQKVDIYFRPLGDGSLRKETGNG